MGCMVFNHHSLPFDHPSGIDEEVCNFLKVCIKLSNAGLRTILVDEAVDRSWFRVQLAEGYSWQDWYNRNSGTEIEYIRAFQSIATQAPQFSPDDIGAGVDLFEVSLDGAEYSAVRAAAWKSAPLTGFPTRPPWNNSPLDVTVNKLNEETEEIENTSQQILNIYSLPICEQELPRLVEERNTAINSGRDLIARVELFPLLTFCGKAPAQLNNWSATTTVFDQVKRSLTALNNYVGLWNTGEYPQYTSDSLRSSGMPFEVSGESPSVRNNPKLRGKRMFWLPDGYEMFFENHVKLANGYRLHFYPDNHAKRIYVGYIGPHLPLS